MLDVHAPHETAHGWRDFLLHLVTITVGLFIALSLEGLVEWRHHRHLVHESEASLHAEISRNAARMKETLDGLEHEQTTLKKDITELKYLEQNRKFPEKADIDLSYRIVTFDNTSFRTVQNTGALAYMSYEEAREYSQIYDEQAALEAAELVATRDTIAALGPFLNMGENDPPPSPEETRQIVENVQTLQGQLMYVSTLMKSLNGYYKAYLSRHPGEK